MNSSAKVWVIKDHSSTSISNFIHMILNYFRTVLIFKSPRNQSGHIHRRAVNWAGYFLPRNE